MTHRLRDCTRTRLSLLIVCILVGTGISLREGSKAQVDARPLEIKFKPESLKGMKYQTYEGGELAFSLTATTARFARRRIGFLSINIRDQLRMDGIGLETRSGKAIEAKEGTLSLSTGKLSLKTSNGEDSIHLKQLLSQAKKSPDGKSGGTQ